MNTLYNLPQSSKNLECTLILLNDWKLIKIEGEDTLQYLQGQLTCNIETMNINQYKFSAHCNPKGKMISNMYIFHINSGIAIIERCNICNKQITEMKKYAIFSKIKISIDNNITLFGIAGFNARVKLNKFFKILPDTKTKIIRENNIIILHFNLPKERFLLVIPNTEKQNIIKFLKREMHINDNSQWIALDIEAGYPIINIENTEKIIPQAANLHLLNGIDFNKGCYIGQEIIARTQYKNTNKKSLYWLIGKYNKSLPLHGNNLEIKINKYWKPTGLILESCKIQTGEIWIQAILHNSITNNIQLRTTKEKILLKTSNLPY